MGWIRGPRGLIRYRRDALGYPHIQARDLNDATWALGYLHAIDRLVQVELTLMAGRGRLMSVLGDKPAMRAMDLSFRALDLTRDLGEQVRRMAPETRAWMQTYCDGFNAGAKKRGRPLLLRALGVPVEKHTPETLVLIYRTLAFPGLTQLQFASELLMTDLIASGAPESVFELLLGEAARGLDHEALSGLELPEAYALIAPAGVAGSNAFAVARERSTSGGALLMSEFHLEVGRFPPIAYAAHLELGGGDYVQGIGFPWMLAFSTGRTRHMGWSYTFGHADNVDVLAERCSDGGHEVGGRWQPMRRRVEVVEVKGKGTADWVFYDNDFGVVMGDASVAGTYPCIRWSGLRDMAGTFDG